MANPEMDRAVGLRLIVFYKLAKAVAELVGSAVLLALLSAGFAEQVHLAALAIRHHVVSAWAVHIADALVRNLTPGHLYMLDAALLLDGILTSVEGWALHRRWWWGPWLVVLATGSLLPFEIIEIVRQVHVGRVVTFVVNVGIVAYLLQHAWRHTHPKPA